MLQKDNQITSTQNFDNLALDISNGGINLKNNDNNQSVELTEGTQSDAASIAGNLAGVFAGMGANASALFSVAFSGGPVTVIGTLVIAGVMVGFMSYKVYKVYQNNQLIRTERASRNLATAVRNNDAVNTNRYSSQIKKSSGYINTSSLNSYYSSNPILNANFNTIQQISVNIKPIYVSIPKINPINIDTQGIQQAVNQLTATNAYLDLMAKDMAEMNAQITRDMQNMISSMNKLNQELAENNKKLEAANVEIAEAVKDIHEMVTHWDELTKQYSIDRENERKDHELNDVPDPLDKYTDTNIITKKVLDSKNNTLEINGIYKHNFGNGGRIRAEVNEIGNHTFSHLKNEKRTYDSTKNYYFDIKADHTFNTKIKLDNFVANGTQLYEVEYYIELNRGEPEQTRLGTKSSFFVL